jgi:drug/metabolite transporter (DMT)-like permease
VSYVIRNESLKILGDLLSFVSSVFFAINLLSATETRKRLSLFIYTFCTSCVAVLTLSMFTILFEGTPMDGSRNSLFGWLFDKELFQIICLFGFTVGMIGLLGLNFAVKYVHPLLLAVIQLLDPPLTALMAWIGNLEPIPGLSTLIGVVIVTIGIGFVIVGEHKRKKTAS